LRINNAATTLNAELAETAESSNKYFSANSARSRLRSPLFGVARRSAFRAKAAALIVVVAVLSGSACRQDMHDQPKYIPLRESTFFNDDRSARPLVTGTVARGQLHEDALLYTGKMNGENATLFPFRVDGNVMVRGRERFDIFCSPCHGRSGAGDGMVVRRGYRRPPSLSDDRLRAAPVGHFFDVISNGFGAMPDYASQIPSNDRWAIVAYIRALQLSEHASPADVPAAEQGRLQ